MATLQKFKLLATQCAVASSPTRSPTTSPVIHLRRRRTLRMLLSRAGGGSAAGRKLPPRPHDPSPKMSPEKRSDDTEVLLVRNKLRDLFISSPPPASSAPGSMGDGMFSTQVVGGGIDGDLRRGGGGRALRPLSATFRQRLLRRAWRPILVGIPEKS